MISYELPMDFIWFPMISYDFLLISYEFLMDFLWFPMISYEFHMISYRNSYTKLRFSWLSQKIQFCEIPAISYRNSYTKFRFSWFSRLIVFLIVSLEIFFKHLLGLIHISITSSWFMHMFQRFLNNYSYLLDFLPS